MKKLCILLFDLLKTITLKIERVYHGSHVIEEVLNAMFKYVIQ